MLTFLPEWRGLPPEEIFPYAAANPGETNGTDIRGNLRRLSYPPINLRPISDDFNWEPSIDRETFFSWCNDEDVWTLTFNMPTFYAAMTLAQEFPKEWEDVKKEIFPCKKNELLHFKHGAPSAYTSGGCRGPLCRAGMRRAMRNHRDQHIELEEYGLEACLVQVATSFQFYLEFIRVLRNYRIFGDKHKRTDPLRWKAVDKRTTILMDVTDV